MRGKGKNVSASHLEKRFLKEIEDFFGDCTARLNSIDTDFLSKSELGYLANRLPVTISTLRKGWFIKAVKYGRYKAGNVFHDKDNTRLILEPLAKLEKRAKTRAVLRKAGICHWHSVFDDFNSDEILFIHKNWRKIALGDIALSLNTSEENVIALARALGKDTVPESLDWWKREYQWLKADENAIDVTDMFAETNSKIIQNGLAQGCRVYALKLYNGRDAFLKWNIDSQGEIKTDANERAEITTSPRGISAAWLCSLGLGNTRNISYDEIRFGRDGTTQGISRKKAREVFEALRLGEQDSYVLFVRKSERIKRDVGEFINRISEVLAKGGCAERAFVFAQGKSKEQCVREQSHPLIADEMVRLWFERRKK